MYTYTAHENLRGIQRDVKVTVSKPLKFMPYAQAGVAWRTIGNTLHQRVDLKILYSYSTEVIRMYDNRYVLCTGTYSQTTRRHISAFAKEYLPERFSYQDVKLLANSTFILDIVTSKLLTEAEVKNILWLEPDYTL